MPPRPSAEGGSFPSGVLNVDKASGQTSFQVVKSLRRLTGAHRVGHAGTLDPLATGVLPILFESATRLAEFAHRLPKTYMADIHLGFTTATDDAEAERVPFADPASLAEVEVAAMLEQFVGRILQEPPAYSAVKVEGRRSYKLARGGEDPRPRAREVEVYSARLVSFKPGSEAVATVEITCGSGTYLRSIARDLGRRLAVGGYLGRLIRTAYGPLSVASASTLETFGEASSVRDRLLPAEVILPEMERVRLNVEQEAMVRQGRAVRVLPEPRPGQVRAHDVDGRLVALGHTDPLRRTFVPEKVLS